MKEHQTGQGMEKPSLQLVIPFQSAREAEIAYNTLSVDKEPKRNECTKTLSLEEDRLILRLEGPETRNLRMSVNSFFDHLVLVQKTIAQFSLENFEDPISKKS